MHSLQLGVYTVINAEGLLMLCKLLPCELPEALKATFRRFKAWCSLNKITCSQRQWTLADMHLTGEVQNFPWLKAKAFNGRVILAWLAAPWPDPTVKTPLK